VNVRAQRRSQILEAAQRLVAEKGWDATTYADLCREAGVSNGVLTYHFKSKEDIRFALLELELKRWRDEFKTEELRQALTAADRTRFALEKTARTIAKRPEFYQSLYYYLVSGTRGDPEQARRIRTFFTELQEHIAEELGAAMDCGLIPRRDPVQMAKVLLTVSHGFSFASVEMGIHAPIEDLIALMTHFIEGKHLPAVSPEEAPAAD
jgi:AcrR family transcriptional regulator